MPLTALRYMSQIPQQVRSYCESRVLDPTDYYYLRMQAASLLCRFQLSDEFLKKCWKSFEDETHAHVQRVLANILMQYGDEVQKKVFYELIFHQNDNVRKHGRMLREMKYDSSKSKEKLKFIFDHSFTWRIVDYFPMIHAAKAARNPEILSALIDHIKAVMPHVRIVQIRSVLKEIRSHCKLEIQGQLV